MNLRFVEIITSQWESNEGRLCSTIFGLTQDGRVYKYIGHAWEELPDNVAEGRKA